LFAILLVCLAFAFSHAQSGFDTMDLKALSARADQLEARVASNSADYATLRDLATVYHFMAVKDSKAYAKKAVQVLERAYEKRPEDYEVLCYLGNAYVLLAKDGGDGMNRAANASKGFGYMDKAVRNAPDDITIRMTRGISAKSSPRFLGRRPVAYEDFEYLAALFDKGLKVPESLKATVYGHLADLYKEDGDAVHAQKYAAMAEKAQKGE
jgi:tetratricopeptide (TPR) repeat protein